MGNVELLPPKRQPIFRKIALGTWARTYDPQVYGTLSLRAEPMLRFIESQRASTGARLTMTHVIAKAAGLCFRHMPDANALLRFSRTYPRRDIDVFLQVMMEDPVTKKPDLSGVVLRRIDELSLQEIVKVTEEAVRKVKSGEDRELAKSRGLLGKLPAFLVGPTLKILSFLLYDLNLDLRWAGIPKDGFGSVMVTNIGSLGLEQAYAPLVPWSRVPMIVAAGAVTDEPVVQDGQVVPGKIIRLCVTFDHRFIDGAHAATLARRMREIFADPEAAFGGG